MKNLPIQNVKKMGLMASATLSLERKIFGFNQNLKPDEDILVNKRTILMDKVDTKYNIDTNIDFKKLVSEEKNDKIKYLHNYFSNQEATEQNDFTGLLTSGPS